MWEWREQCGRVKPGGQWGIRVDDRALPGLAQRETARPRAPFNNPRHPPALREASPAVHVLPDTEEQVQGFRRWRTRSSCSSTGCHAGGDRFRSHFKVGSRKVRTMSLADIEQKVIELTNEERRQFVAWFY